MILKFTNGYFSKKIDMGEIIVVKIACEDGTLYALGNDLSIIQINSDDNRITIPVDDINTEAITDFKVKNGVLYIVTSEGDVGTTYILNTKGEIKERNIKKLKGRIFDENTIYQVELLPEEGHSIGHSCEMKIIDIKSGDTESIILESEYWVVGAQFLGYDSDGNYRIKMFEMATNENFNIVVEETIRTIGKDGSTKAIRGLDTQFKSITNQVKVFGNDIYELNNLKDKVQIINISEPNEKTTSSYKSKLQNIVEPISDLDPDITNGDNQLMISRSTIMSNAKSFHSSFRWSCQSKNLEPLTNWTKPRYVGSAGTYQYMPYCWGGFSSIDQYNSGMSGTGRVGNINTSTSGHVSNTYGLDCSGYVSRCWGTSTKYGTSTIMNIAKKINASDLLEGDALNNSGSHIVLFEKYDGAGNYVLYESTKLNSYDRVSHTVRSISSMGNYVPIRYNGVSK
ncbi:hypothetical protein SAMN05660923_02903 [Tepidimicrobium xylanilyticum]|uniref:Uncharacterized protein n=1 Tax=Tepidimicrobium xylanilyticum TaxID=1123352 RepID=A0A1H3EGT5_9FIRM|nr:hypothetical protein SAMN05660923_02903 [Tepidimicrobium xylanilyticum]